MIGEYDKDFAHSVTYRYYVSRTTLTKHMICLDTGNTKITVATDRYTDIDDIEQLELNICYIDMFRDSFYIKDVYLTVNDSVIPIDLHYTESLYDLVEFVNK